MSEIICQKCKGLGYLIEKQPMYVECPDCLGAGFVNTQITMLQRIRSLAVIVFFVALLWAGVIGVIYYLLMHVLTGGR